MSGQRWRRVARIAAVAGVVLLIGSNGAGVAAAAPAEPASSVVPDAYLHVPIDGGRAVARWNGTAAGYTLAKARAVLPGRFDAAGGGVFVYRAGAAPDGVLRIRQHDGALALSLRSERVDGHYAPVTGDFDGNGFTDILWNQEDGGGSYLWLFRADGSHASRPFPNGYDGTMSRPAMAADVNVDGITDVVWPWADEVWIMHVDGSHTKRVLPLSSRPGFTTFVSGNIGPADGVTRRRTAVVYEGSYEELLTANLAGQTARKVVRAHTGTCCAYQPAIGGHFRSGYVTTLFFHSPSSSGTEYLQDITPGGNLVTTPAPQLTAAYASAVGDFDGNGFDDVLLSNRTGATRLLASDGNGFTTNDPADIPARSTVVAVPMT